MSFSDDLITAALKESQPAMQRKLLLKAGAIVAAENKDKWQGILNACSGNVKAAEYCAVLEQVIPAHWRKEGTCQNCGPVLLPGEPTDQPEFCLMCRWCEEL
jgi:hypothetical protein